MRETTVADETAALKLMRKREEARHKAQLIAAQELKAISMKVRELEDEDNASGLVDRTDLNDARILRSAAIELVVRANEMKGDWPASVIGGQLKEYVQILNSMLKRNVR